MMFEAFQQIGIVCPAGLWLAHDHHIKAAQCVLVMAETFPGQTLEPIAIDRTASVPAGHRHTQARVVKTVWPSQKREKTVFRPFSLAKQAPKIVTLIQARSGREAPFPRRSHTDPQGVRRARPLARRALSTLRPPLVAMRARKPWVRLRRRLLG